ncbi:phosphatase PAP2 family protein [Lysobacter sp. CA196]|uniref:phosphatase PAP2 family protein n=1 Tax=Lysobacter sp. CA196 TaxID=3455606 RepID=UPI003F8D0843
MNDSSNFLARPRPAGPLRHVASQRFLRAHLVAPSLVWFALTVWAMGAGGDVWLADRFYAWQGGRWALQNAYLTEQLIHRFGRDASTAAWCGVLALWIVARLRPGLSEWRRPLAYLLLSTVLAIALVSALKSLTDMDCPWDLSRYGGANEFFGLFASRPPGLARGRCFPAGHASAGYAWVALYFFFPVVQPHLRWLGLAIGLGLGLLFGVSQQLRGAHFLSHDLWTLGIAWSATLALYLAMAPHKNAAPAAVALPLASRPGR